MITSQPSMHSTGGNAVPKPLGYWVKRIHNGLEDNLDAQLGEFGLNRRTWQVLNTVASGPIELSAIERALEPFRDHGEPVAAPCVAALCERGALEPDRSARYVLTAAGLTLHRSAADRAHAARRAVMRGIAPQEYEQLIDLLRRVAENIDPGAHG